MTAFQKRMADGKAHELAVLEKLIRHGWDAEYFGQAMLSERMREYLRTQHTHVRWMPDVIAGKRVANRTVIAFVDAKGGHRWKDTGNHDIEKSALKAAEKWIDLSGETCPFYFVFGDFRVATPADVRDNCADGIFNGRGSGTPFVLVPADKCRPFESVFGDPLAAK